MDNINLLPSDVFQIMSESTSAGMYVIEGEKFIYVNPAFTSITGYTINELRNFTFWQWVHQDHKDLVKNRGLQRQTGNVELPIRYEVKIVSKTNFIIALEELASLLKIIKEIFFIIIEVLLLMKLSLKY